MAFIAPDREVCKAEHQWVPSFRVVSYHVLIDVAATANLIRRETRQA